MCQQVDLKQQGLAPHFINLMTILHHLHFFSPFNGILWCYLNNPLSQGDPGKPGLPGQPGVRVSDSPDYCVSNCKWRLFCLIISAALTIPNSQRVSWMTLCICHQGLPGPSGPAGEKVRLIQLGAIIREAAGQQERDATAEHFIMWCNEFPSWDERTREPICSQGNDGARGEPGRSVSYQIRMK